MLCDLKPSGIRQRDFKGVYQMKKTLWLLFILILLLASGTSFAENKYTIQLGAFKTEEGRATLEKKLLSKDFDYFHEDEGKLLVVNHGVFDLYSEALEVQQALKSKGFNGFVKQIDEELIPVSYLKGKLPVEEFKVDTSRNALNVIIEEDIVFTGVYGGQVLFFTVNENWDMTDDGYILLRYSHSIPETYRGSTMTILVNNVPVHSVLLNNRDEEVSEVRIPISKDYLREGVNELTIRTYHRITDLLCDDDSNPGNWVVIFKNTHLHLGYELKKDGNTLKEYPYPYLQPGGNDPVTFELMLGENYIKEHLNKALLVSADMGRRIKFENLEPRMGVYSPSRNYSKNIIFVGDVKRLPGVLQDTLTKQEIEATKTYGLIKEIVSPFNPEKKLLMILSDTDEYLLKSVQVLSRESTNNQFNKASIIVDEETWLNTSVERQDEYITLEEMGYSQITMAGQRFASAIIDYKVSDEWVLREDAHLYMKLRYTDVIDFDNSSVTIKVNGIPIFSKKLVSEGVQEDAFFVELPQEVRHYSFLRVEVNFTLDVIRDCKNGTFDPNVWAYISNESYFYLPHDPRLNSSLVNYPYPLVSDGLFNNFKLVIDENQNLSSLSALFTHLGHSIEEVGEFSLYYDGEDVPLEGNILYIGNPENSGFMNEINDGLAIGYDQNLRKYRREQLDLVSVDEESVSILQLASVGESKIMTLTGLNEEILDNAMRYLYDFEYINRLSGFADVIYFNGNMDVLIADEDEVERISINQKREVNTEALQRISGSEVRRFIIFVAIILFGIFVVVILRRNH